MIIKNLFCQSALLFMGNLGTLELLIILVPAIIIIVVVTVVVWSTVNNRKKLEKRREEALRAMYSRKDSQRSFRIEAICNLKEKGKPFDEYDIELEMERIRTSKRE